MTFSPDKYSPEAEARVEMETYGASNREVRNQLAKDLRLKMAKELAAAWNRGQHDQVRDTIARALDSSMCRQWKDDTAAELHPDQREFFFNYVRG